MADQPFPQSHPLPPARQRGAGGNGAAAAPARANRARSGRFDIIPRSTRPHPAVSSASLAVVPSADAGSGDTVPLPSATPSGSWRETLDVPEVSGVLRQISASEQLVEAMAAGGGSGAFRTAGVGVVYRSAPWDGVQLDRMAGSTEIEFVSDEPLPWYDDPRCRVAVIACCAVIPLVVRWLLH